MGEGGRKDRGREEAEVEEEGGRERRIAESFPARERGLADPRTPSLTT